MAYPGDMEGDGIAQTLNEVSYPYKYPGGRDLKPGSKTHNKLVSYVLTRAQESNTIMQNRYESWRSIENSLTAFVDPTKISDARKDSTKSVPVVVPVTYATMETLLTYMSAVFLQDEIFKYEGVGPEDRLGTILLQHIVNVHARKYKMGLNLHTQWRDMFSYGFGAVSPYWKQTMGKPITMKKGGFYDFLGKFIPTKMLRRIGERETVFEGNALDNIDPYSILLDPNAPIQDIQAGEYFGWVVTGENYMSMLERERDTNDGWFNCKYLRHIDARSQIAKLARDERRLSKEDKGDIGDGSISSTRPADSIHMYCNLIPAEHGLGRSDYPEKWLIVLTGDEIITKAKPLGLAHDKYLGAICASDYDGYTAVPIAKLEILQGMQGTIDWLFTSHIANVRKAINDMLIYDPSLVYSGDLKNPEPGKLVRLRKAAWGRGVKDAVMQLNVNDITRANMGDLGIIKDLMYDVGGAADPIRGQVRSGGERRSATEYKETKAGALSRIEKAARIVSMQSMMDLGEFFASHTQQFLSDEVYVKIVGEKEKELREEHGKESNNFKVRPQDILVNYDVMPSDGSMPGGEHADTWVSLFQTIAQHDTLAGQFDMVRIFKHIARLTGAKNLTDFENKTNAKPQVMGDEELGQQVDKGNLASVDEVVRATE